MAEYLIQDTTLKGIADAIRAKNGTTEEIAVADMAAKISEITGGGGSSDDVRYVTFMSYDGTVEYGKKAVAVGDDCADPIARGVFGTPTRESTAQYTYTFAGWATTPNGGLNADALKSVVEDRTVYANFISTVRSYTISYYDGDTLLKTESLPYGSTPTYVPKKDGYVIKGWTPTFTAVTGDATYYAQWEEAETVLYSGDCGENATWRITSGGTLKLSGTGEITGYNTITNKVPWNSHLSSIKAVVVEDGITNVPQGCCWNGSASATNLTSVTLADTVTLIDYSAFYGCTALKSVHFGNGLIEIGGYAFRQCTGLSGDVVFPNSLEELSGGAFEQCNGITSVTFGSGIKKLSETPFSNCSNLQSVYVPNLSTWCKIEFKGNYTNPFASISGLKNLYANGVLVEGNITIPSDVTAILQHTFNNIDKITGVTVPDSVTSIAAYAFAYCDGLKNITIGNGVTYIAAYAFSSSAITSATFQNTTGWWVADTASATSGTNITVTSPSTAATYLKNTYKGKHWFRS